MKRILLPSYLLSCATFPVTTASTATSPGAISYVFRPEGPRANTLKVELTFQVGAWRETKILLPKGWGTQNDAYRCVQNLRVSSEGTAIANTGDPLIRLVTHPLTSRVTIKYELVSDVNAGHLEGDIYYRPIINEQFFYMLGNSALVLPDFTTKETLRFSMKWLGFMEGWSLANSFGVGQRVQEFKATLEQLQKGVFLGSDLRIRKLEASVGSVYLATRSTWRFPDRSLELLTVGIAREACRIWHDKLIPYFLVIVFPTDNLDTRGERRTNCLTLYLSRGSADPSEFDQMLAHELFHAWKPGRLGDLQDEHLYWFTEGFTDYYASIVLLRLGKLGLLQKTS